MKPNLCKLIAKRKRWMPMLSAFLDMVQLADHPGDMLAYRHLRLMPTVKSRYPDGMPSAVAFSTDLASRFNEQGVALAFSEYRDQIRDASGVAWSADMDAAFAEMLEIAKSFDANCGVDMRISDFPRYYAEYAEAKGEE